MTSAEREVRKGVGGVEVRSDGKKVRRRQEVRTEEAEIDEKMESVRRWQSERRQNERKNIKWGEEGGPKSSLADCSCQSEISRGTGWELQPFKRFRVAELNASDVSLPSTTILELILAAPSRQQSAPLRTGLK